MKVTEDLISMSNSDLFNKYNRTLLSEFNQRVELRAAMERRLIDDETKAEILSHLPEIDSRRTMRESAYRLVADLLVELDPEAIWRVDTTMFGGISHLTVGEAEQMYRNTAKYGL